MDEAAKRSSITCDDDYRDIGSYIHIDSAKRWIKDCLENHDCSSYGGMRPSRLLFVGDDLSPARIVENEPSAVSAPYVALSHCWGPNGLPDTAKTLLQNLKTRTESVSLASLPRSFQDAAEITRRLDYRYVWIDALCIVQDDKNDWVREGAQMG